MGVEIVEYLKRIDATLAPYCGHFVLHGGRCERLEGDWRGDLVAIEFPNRDLARAWYRSAAYQAILPLRTDKFDWRCDSDRRGAGLACRDGCVVRMSVCGQAHVGKRGRFAVRKRHPSPGMAINCRSTPNNS
ncbi:DUF1330 domain-containing protein [Paraburkholderia caribensis]|uniref:DUF1330 domain-containing protein n=1 Tax=Paraburkholderia caribensis TaxID=75105 RepID=UPI003AADDEA6